MAEDEKKKKVVAHADWLERVDPSGHLYKQWAKVYSPHSFYCNVCMATLDCSAKGFQALSQHAAYVKHKKNMESHFDTSQLCLSCAPALTEGPTERSQQPASSSQSNLTLKAVGNQDTLRRELLWVMRTVQHNQSALSCEGLGDFFREMFGAEVVADFDLGRQKVGYLKTECLGPYFYEKIVEDASKSYYTLCFDETTNEKGVKELRIMIRYWSEILREVFCCHLQTFFLGHAFAVIVIDYLLKALTNGKLSPDKMLMASCDGPNVNKAVIRDLCKAIVKEYPNFKGFLSIGTCNLHVAHNSFKKGLSAFDACVGDLIYNIYKWFDDFPSRTEDFKKILVRLGLPVHEVLNYVSSRWLSMVGPGKRLLEQWPAHQEYFLKFLPNSKSSEDVLKMSRYKEIKSCLKNPTMKAEVTFMIESAALFEKFSRLFQRSDPMIYVLYSEVKELATVLAGRVCKKAVVDRLFNIDKPFAPENLIFAKDLKCGDLTEKELKEDTIKDIDVLKFRQCVQNFFKGAGQYLLDKSILNSPVARHFRCLNPFFVTDERCLVSVEKVAKALPIDVSVTELLDEWKLLQRQELPKFCNGERIDHFWRQIFDLKSPFDEVKFPQVVKFVKAALCVSHGSSDVERGFSESSNVLTNDKTRMHERTLNAKFNIKAGLKLFHNKPELVPMTKELLNSGRLAYMKYRDYLESEKKIEEEKTRKRKNDEEQAKKMEEMLKSQKKMRKEITELENEAKELKKTQKEEVRASDSLLLEGQKKLEKALQQKDLGAARVAYGMISGAQEMRKKVQDTTEANLGAVTAKLKKRQSNLITSFFKSNKGPVVQEDDDPDNDLEEI